MKFIPPFWQIDAAIIAGVFQPIANFLSARTTPKNIGLFFAVGSICATGVLAVLSSGQDRLVSICLNFIFFLEYIAYSKQNDSALSKTSAKALNPIKAFFRLIQLLIALMCLAQVIVQEIGWAIRGLDVEVLCDVVFLAATMFSTAAMYFLACDQPPPRQRFSWSARVATASGRN